VDLTLKLSSISTNHMTQMLFRKRWFTWNRINIRCSINIYIGISYKHIWLDSNSHQTMWFSF
jgi:hypothetical protein